LLANLIYGPSYVSLDYALDYHGFIPERSEALTSVTIGRSRKFHTPVGLFIYRRIPIRAYDGGMVLVEEDYGQAFLIASAEKALADKVISERGVSLTSAAEMRRFLTEDLRVDISKVQSLSAERIDEYAGRYRSRKLKHLSGLVRSLENLKRGSPMNEAIRQILAKYEIRSLDDSVRAPQRIMQEIALLGLWRSKFFEKAAFYGGTALRVLFGLDRFSEDLDFSLLERNEKFDLASYHDALKKELSAFGFEVEIGSRKKCRERPYSPHSSRPTQEIK